MGDHFSAFSFVDRIHDYIPGARARADVRDSRAGLPAFPSCLVAEAVGQLASWVAMAHIEFRGRPVAALALETRFLRDAQPGETLELAVELESCDDEAVAYHGWADVDGARALELIDCLGPDAAARPSSIRRRRCASASACSAAPARTRAASRHRRFQGRAGSARSRASRPRRRCTCRTRRRSSATTSRADRCSRRRCS